VRLLAPALRASDNTSVDGKSRSGARSGARIAAVDNGLRRQFDIWRTYQPDANKILRFRWLIGWLIESFNPKRFPWFKDEFTISTSC
jgi:hypothetical protein